MSVRGMVAIVESVVFSLEIERARCVLARLFLVRSSPGMLVRLRYQPQMLPSGFRFFGGAKRRSGKRAGRGLQIGQPAFSGKPDELGIRSHAGLGLDEIVIILNSLHAEIEI